MTLIIVILLLLGYLVIATGHLTGVNKAAIAVFIGTVGWVVYICYGTDYVMAHHAVEYLAFLAGNEPSSDAVKYFIYDEVFLYYVGRAASIVMFLLATMSIIEILNNNGCFDFISKWIKTRNSKRLLWTITLATFIISANLDNLTTTMTMLVIMRQIVQNRRQRMLIGSAIVIAANCGGCFTVIGDPTGLLLWGAGAITATHFSSFMAMPAILAWIIPTALISRELPERFDIQWSPMPYRGDDTNLSPWQRILMLFVGIGGLWFIPTFHTVPWRVVRTCCAVGGERGDEPQSAALRPDVAALYPQGYAIRLATADPLRDGYHAGDGCGDGDGCLRRCGRVDR